MKCSTIAIAAALAAAMLSGISADAAPITIPNYSFETPEAPIHGVVGWNYSENGNYIETRNAPAVTGLNGTQWLSIWGDPGAAADGFVYCVLEDKLQVGTYTLTVGVGAVSATINPLSSYLLQIGVLSGPMLATYAGGPSDVQIGTLTDKSISLMVSPDNANLGGNILVAIHGQYTGDTGTNGWNAFDNVRLDYAVPEPGMAIALLLAGAGLLGGSRKRRK